MEDLKAWCTPDTNLRQVVRLMLEADYTLVPVLEAETHRVLGQLTQLQITEHLLTVDREQPPSRAGDVMQAVAPTLAPEEPIEPLCAKMQGRTLTGVLVVDHRTRCIGLIPRERLLDVCSGRA